MLSSICMAQRHTTLINQSSLQDLQESGTLHIIDVRTEEEFAKGFIKGAINIDFWDPEFESRVLNGYNKKDKILIYCAGGGRSAMACEKLSKNGFKNLFDLDGGYESIIR